MWRENRCRRTNGEINVAVGQMWRENHGRRTNMERERGRRKNVVR